MAETAKARERRLRERFFERYLRGHGVDVGCGDDPVTPDCVRWEREQGPLQGSYDWVYSSHCLEHLENPLGALARWWDCVKPGGHLVVVVPHRDLYERKTERPSRWNGEHRTFWLPDRHAPTCTLSLFHAVHNACPGAALQRLTVEDTGWDGSIPLDQHPSGEYSIEGVWRKPA